MNGHALSRLRFGIKTLFVAAWWLAFAVPSGLGQAGAAAAAASSLPANAPYVATMKFDVASVRENKKIDMSVGYTMGGWFVAHTTTFRVTNLAIEDLLADAYGVQHYQIVNAPPWPWPTLFMVEAKSDSEADAKLAALTEKQQAAEQQHMLQSLLEDRFKLKTHWETREGDVYNLVLAKGGSKMSPAGSMPQSEQEKEQFGDRPVQPLLQRCDGQGCVFIAHAYPMDEWIGMLAANFGRTVINKTELTGKYDFLLKYIGRWDRDRPADDMDPTPPMDRALQEQLGLKVEPAKGPVKVLVIDHIEKPSEN
jgi:uncharacterized protein (TIGR03435 family)